MPQSAISRRNGRGSTPSRTVSTQSTICVVLQGCCSCRCMGGFMIQGWNQVPPVCGRTSTLTHGATLPPRAELIILGQSATTLEGWSLHAVQGGIGRGGHRFRPRNVRVEYFGAIADQENACFLTCVRRDLRVGSRGNFSTRWLLKTQPIGHKPKGVELLHRAGDGIDREKTVSAPCPLEQ